MAARWRHFYFEEGRGDRTPRGRGEAEHGLRARVAAVAGARQEVGIKAGVGRTDFTFDISLRI